MARQLTVARRWIVNEIFLLTFFLMSSLLVARYYNCDSRRVALVAIKV